VTTIDHFLLLKKTLDLYVIFVFGDIHYYFFDDQPQEKRKRKICEKNTRISVFGAHDLRKKDSKKNPILRSARETSSIALKNIHHPLPLLLQLQKKEQLIIFCVIKKKSFMKIIPLGLV